MIAKSRRGLGRGLSALLSEEGGLGTGDAVAEGGGELPIELIHRNPEQPRRQFSEAELAELEASIRDKGVLQPILVRPSPRASGEYEIVAGERRWRAAQRVGLRAIPALVRALNDNRALEITLIENVQREDLNALEEAFAYKAMMERFDYTQEKAAAAVGKSRSHVANAVRLTTLPEDVRDHLIAGRLTAGHARALLSAEDPRRIAEMVVRNALSVRETEIMAKGGAIAPKKASGPRRKPKDADTVALEANLEDVLGMSVDIVDCSGVGVIRIKYATLEQLDELCRRLTRA